MDVVYLLIRKCAVFVAFMFDICLVGLVDWSSLAKHLLTVVLADEMLNVVYTKCNRDARGQKCLTVWQFRLQPLFIFTESCPCWFFYKMFFENDRCCILCGHYVHSSLCVTLSIVSIKQCLKYKCCVNGWLLCVCVCVCVSVCLLYISKACVFELSLLVRSCWSLLECLIYYVRCV